MSTYPRWSAGALILPLYLLLTIAIGWIARRTSSTSNAYLDARSSLPL